MSWDVRPCTSLAEQRDAMSAIWHYFGRAAPGEDQLESLSHLIPRERLHAARDGDGIVGGAGAFPFQLTVPGNRIPAAGVTVVGVQPTHRRRGVLGAMMRAQLDDVRARGESVAYLWASEERIYGRFGYGLASLTGEIDVAREHTALDAPRVEPFGRARLVPLAEAEPLVAPVWERVAADTPGMFARSSAWWRTRTLTDPDWRRAGGGELRCVVLEADRGPIAHALYRFTPAFDRGVANGTLQVVEAIGDSPRATRAIWRYLLDMDLVGRVRAAQLPLDHPLFLLAAEPRYLRFSVRDGLWVRLVDVGAALAVRAYAGAGSVVVDVADAFCPWNAGRWRVGDGGAARTTDAPDLRCDVTALGSVYLGGFTWTQQAAALRVEALGPGAVERADALFRTDRLPWCPEIF